MKGERERPHVSDRGLDGKRANKKEPMECPQCSMSSHRVHGVRPTPTSRVSQLVGAEEIRLYEMPPSLQQIPTCRTFCFKNLGFLSSRLVRAPGKKAHHLMTPHLWSTLQVGGLDHSHAFWNYSCEKFGGVAW